MQTIHEIIMALYYCCVIFQVFGIALHTMEVTDIVNGFAVNDKRKIILIWTSPEADPIKNLGTGQEAFLERKCAQINCQVTSDRHFFRNVSTFDVIIFHGPELVWPDIDLPTLRSVHQIYVFSSMESPIHSPICDQKLNRFFNWTWTYKLNSDCLYGYIIIKDKSGNIIGPNKNIDWVKVENMKPISKTFKDKLDSKRKAAAWFVSNCRARNNRRQIALEIKEELEKHGFTLDVYGKCGWISCAKNSMEYCSKLIENHYYFYLSFENAFSEDYVTEKLLRALKHFAVPVVYGGANYTRFMPDGIYLNARKVDIEDLVKQMVYLMNNKEQYYNYFRWHNHYSYHSPTEFPETDPYCTLCAAVNGESSKRVTNYENFVEWWNDAQVCP